MSTATDFESRLESKVAEQLRSQRVAYLLGAGSSYLDGEGYPLASEPWNVIKNHISDVERREEIDAKLALPETQGIEHALDLLDDGGPVEGTHRHLVAAATAEFFASLTAPLDHHVQFVERLSRRGEPHVKIFSLNYDPLIELAAARKRIRLHDGFLGHGHAFFEPSVFDERIFRIRGTHKGRQTDETAMPLQLLKLHGSIGWYECRTAGVRRCGFSLPIPEGTKRLMIPPQKRKAADTMSQPYAALWSCFRGALAQDQYPLNRLVCTGYGFEDEHVNTLIESALTRTDFTALILTKKLSEDAWNRWSGKSNVITVTEERSSLKGEVGVGHANLCRFESLARRV